MFTYLRTYLQCTFFASALSVLTHSLKILSTYTTRKPSVCAQTSVEMSFLTISWNYCKTLDVKTENTSTQKCKNNYEAHTAQACRAGGVLVEYIAANYTHRAELLFTESSYISPGLRGTAGNVARSAMLVRLAKYSCTRILSVYVLMMLLRVLLKNVHSCKPIWSKRV